MSRPEAARNDQNGPPALRRSDEGRQEGAEHALSYDTTVPRALVHRAAVAEVFLTDSRQVGENRYDIAAQLPRAHIMGERSGRHDFLLLVEVLRQSGVLIAHTYEGVSLEDSFIFRRLEVKIENLAALRSLDRPARAVITMDCIPRKKRNGRTNSLDFTGALAIEGHTALVFNGGLAFFNRSAYRALRRRQRAALADSVGILPSYVAAHPSVVGRRDPYNVVITQPSTVGESALAATVLTDLTHPHLFDHQLDHIPGNLLLEAARQMAVASVASMHSTSPDGLQVASLEVRFREFAELDLPTRAVAHVQQFRLDEGLGALVVPVEVGIRQRDQIVATVRLEVAQ